MASTDQPDASPQPPQDDHPQETPVMSLLKKNVGAYRTSVTEQVHRNIAALQHVQRKQNEMLNGFYAERDEIVRRFTASANEHNAQFAEWIAGSRKMTLMEERLFVPNRWVPANTEATFTGIPCYWGRILNRLPFFKPTQAEMAVLKHVKNVEVVRCPGIAVPGGWKVVWNLKYVFEPNDWISEGAEVVVEYVEWGEFPRGRLEQCRVRIVKDNVWKSRVVEDKSGGGFFDVFSADENHQDQQFVHLLTLCVECVPNQWYWFNETVLQKKNMQNLGWASTPEYDYTSGRVIEDKFELPCANQ